MQQKKVLIISPLPTHPQNAANRARVYLLSMVLKNIGFDVHFLFTGREKGDNAAMNAYWRDRIYYFNNTQKKTSILNRLQYLFYYFRYSPEEWKYNYLVDDWYDTALDNFINEVQVKEPFDAVIVEYVFLSKALLNFGPDTLKLLDTHDIFSNRFALYLQNNQQPQWFSTYAHEEIKALNRADIVIAVQHHEKEFFEKITNARVIEVGHILPFKHSERSNFEKTLLFVASHNPINRDGITVFIDTVFRKLSMQYPDAKLLIAGTICNVLNQQNNIVLWGEFDEPDTVYGSADIVINPVRFGTGINTKTIEALCYGKPLVATTPATRGLEDGRNKAFLVADTADEFVAALSGLIENAGQRDMLQRNAEAFMHEYHQYNMSQLKAVLTL